MDAAEVVAVVEMARPAQARTMTRRHRRSDLVDEAVRATLMYMGINAWLALLVCHGLGERSDFVREVRANFREMTAR